MSVIWPDPVAGFFYQCMCLIIELHFLSKSFLFPTTEISSKENQKTAERISPPSPDRPPHSQTSSSCFYHVISKVPRLRTPSYSPTQRSPGCRPLPSAGKGLH